MIPKEFVDYVFRERVKLIKEMMKGRMDNSILIGFTRHNAAIITCGKEGLNGSIKGIGFIHKKEYLNDTLQKMRRELTGEYNLLKAANFLLNEIYVEEKIDLGKFITLELAKKHTWKNLINSKEKRATILFFTPPSTSYEVRCSAEIHENDEIWEYANSLHDIFHRPKIKRKWENTPAYLFKIERIYDNSEDKMGTQIF